MGAKVADVDENAKEMRRFLYIYYKMSIFALKNKLYEKDKFYRTVADGRAEVTEVKVPKKGTQKAYTKATPTEE